MTVLGLGSVPMNWEELKKMVDTLCFEEPEEYVFDALRAAILEIKTRIDISQFSTVAADNNLYSNRYSNALPYDYNRVTDPDNQQWYYNASHIQLSDEKSYIAAQGPQDADRFLEMLEIKKIATVVNLTMAREAKREKCYNYWENDTIYTLYTNDKKTCWGVQKIQEEVVLTEPELQKERLVERTFVVRYEDGSQREIKQFHYEHWPDQCAPSLSLLKELLTRVRDATISQTAPIVVHCSAGLGRTGVFIAGMHLMETMRGDDENVDIRKKVFHVVKDLRLQRMGMVTSKSQFEILVSLGEELASA